MTCKCGEEMDCVDSSENESYWWCRIDGRLANEYCDRYGIWHIEWYEHKGLSRGK